MESPSTGETMASKSPAAEHARALTREPRLPGQRRRRGPSPSVLPLTRGRPKPMSTRAQALRSARREILSSWTTRASGSAPVTLRTRTCSGPPALRLLRVSLRRPGRLLVHRRHRTRRSGAASDERCSHPHHGEAVDAPRGPEELGLEGVALTGLRLRVPCGVRGRRRRARWVHVFAGRAERGAVRPEPGEMDAVEWLAPDDVDALIAGDRATTPWFEIAWPKVRAAREAGRII